MHIQRKNHQPFGIISLTKPVYRASDWKLWCHNAVLFAVTELDRVPICSLHIYLLNNGKCLYMFLCALSLGSLDSAV